MPIVHARSGNDNHYSAKLDGLTSSLAKLQSKLLAEGRSFSECEAGLLAAANEAVRRCLESDLQRRADALPRNLRIGGFEYQRHQPGHARYYSLCGELRVRRHTYRRCGERNGPTVVPAELDAGLIEKCTPALAYALAQGHAKAPIRIVERELRAAHRIVLRAAFRADPVMKARGWRETVDWYHLMQYLARILAVLIHCPTERMQVLDRWRAALLRSDRAILSIVRWMHRWLFGLDAKSRKFRAFVRVHGIYLVYWRHFRYASLRSLGLHAGSGVTEGACKSIIKMRTNRSGQRWTKKGVEGVLAIASPLESDRLGAAWPHFERRYRVDCIAA